MSGLLYVGNLYYGSVFREGKLIVDDHFLVVDEYERPEEFNQVLMYCLLMSIRTGAMHEVQALRLKTPRYKRVG